MALAAPGDNDRIHTNCGQHDADEPQTPQWTLGMTLELMVARYGLIAVFVGAGLEGEASVIAGGALAHRGLVSLAGVMASAACGSFAADQTLFLIGRRYRDAEWVRRLHHKPAFRRTITLIERYPAGFIFAFRFLYGVRLVSPVAIGTTKIAARRFVLVNAAAALVWATGFSMAGYVFGSAIGALIGGLVTPARIFGLAGVIMAVARACWLFHRRKPKPPPPQA